MKISEWFNPRDIKHLKGYTHLRETGLWPEVIQQELKSLNLESDFVWEYNVRKKIADCWMKKIIWDDKADRICKEILDEMDEEDLFYEIEHKEE